MKDSMRTGISFGLTSAVITTLGLMVGLHSGTHSKIVVLAGVLTIAIADAFSDALGIHVSEEADNTRTARQVWGGNHCDISNEVPVRTDLCSSGNFSLPLCCHHRKFAMGSFHSYRFELHHRKVPRRSCLEDCR